MNYQEKSCGAVIFKVINDVVLYLLLKHKNGEHWSFPKGHVEQDETEEETATREIEEETGLIISKFLEFEEKIYYQPKNGITKQVVYFLANYENNDSVKIQEEEILDYKWSFFKDSLQLLTYKNSKNILISANNFIISNGLN